MNSNNQGILFPYLHALAMSCGCPDFLAASRGESLLMFIRLRSPSCCRQQLKQSALPRSAAQCAGVLPSSVTKQQESKGKDGDSA